MIYAYDLETETVVIRQVLALYRGSTTCWVDIALDTHVMRTTREHPIWVKNIQDWVAAAKLTSGMQLLLEDGRLLQVNDIALLPQPQSQITYNLHVEDVNNFFVGELGVLVHNATPLGQPGHSVYVLRNSQGKIYYVGRFGPNETPRSVMSRHSRTPRGGQGPARFSQANGDRLEVVARNQTYAQARRLEHELCVRNRTYIGRGNSWRGNRDYPMSPRKMLRYYRPDAC